MRGVSVWAYRERPSGHLFPGVGDGIHEVAPLATEGKVMRPPFVVSLLAVALLAVAFAALPSSEAPTGFDNQSNGMVDDATHQADQVKFDEVEHVSDGLGPLYNAQSCRECHQSPVSGGGSQVAELRVGHEGAHHRFENAEIPIARGTEIITGRTLVNDRAICPNGAFPNTEIQERLPDSENVRTTRLFPDEVTKLCNTVSEPNDVPDPDGLDDLDHFARFIRATKAPARDGQLAVTPQTRRGSELFEKVGCATCHVRALTTAPAGTKINGGKFTISDALGAKTFHPYSDFLMHNVGTGDGIVVPMLEHYGRRMYQTTWRNFSGEDFHNARFKVRTAPLWSVRLRSRLMHDGASVTLRDAVTRHGGEASEVIHHFEKLSHADQEAILEFLRSL